MQRLVTGVDENGASCIVDEGELALETSDGFPGFSMAIVYSTHDSPPPPRPAARSDLLDLGLAPGFVRWMVIDYEPNAVFSMHHTDSVDFDLVLHGSVEVTLDDGVHRLGSGDCIVMTGVDHGWRAGPEGCRLSVTAIGTPQPG